jgi:tetratricopeptide (TPR) repeat protein/transcriptional regulator with XRE-family HTH domain
LIARLSEKDMSPMGQGQSDSIRLTPFGALLRRYRTGAGLTQEELAERAGISVRNLRDLERGMPQRPRRTTIERLAASLALPPTDQAVFVAAARRQGTPVPEQSGASPLAAPPFVGRARELALFDRHLAGQGPPLLVVTGEPGIGKSRLLQAAAARAVGYGLRVLAGGCGRQGGETPYTPLLEALQGYLLALPPTALRPALEDCAWLVRLLPELAGGLIEPLPAWTLPPEQERRLMTDAVKRVLTNIAGPSGILLLLDDLQWAEVDALGLLGALARSAPAVPLRIMAAYRDTEVREGDPLAGTVGDLAQAGLVTRCRIGPLAQAEAEWLLEQLVTHAPERRSTIAGTVERVGGVPFFLVSWARMLQEDYLGSEAEQSGVPWTIVQGVRHRLAGLSQDARDVVGIAAVAGRIVPRAILAQAAERATYDLVEILEELCRSQLIEETGMNGYRFIHDLIREVTEASLGTARRALVHRKVAEALLSGPGEPPVEDVAFHYARAEDHAAAALWLGRAGDRAVASLAHSAALDYYRAACEQGEAGSVEPALLSQLKEKLGDLYLLRIELEQARQLFAQAWSREPDQVRRADLRRKEGIAWQRLGNVAAALQSLDAAEKEGSASIPLPPIIRGTIHADRAFALYYTGDFIGADTEVRSAFTLLHAEPPSPALDRVLAFAAWVQAISRDIRGDVAGARESAIQILVHAERIGDQQYIGRAYLGLGVCAWRAAQLEEAEKHTQAARPILKLVNDLEYLIACSWVEGQILSSRGDPAAAERHLRRGLTAMTGGNHIYFIALFSGELGRLACLQGALPAADAWFERGMELRKQMGDQRGIAENWNGMGMIARARGDLVGAVGLYRRARRLARRTQAFIAEVDAIIGHSTVCLAAPMSPPARFSLRLAAALLARGRTLVTTYIMPESAIMLTLLGAEVDLRRHLNSEARKAAAEALNLAGAAGLGRLEALAQRLLGQCALATGDFAEAQGQLSSASARLDDMGFAPDAAYCRRLLEQALLS